MTKPLVLLLIILTLKFDVSASHLLNMLREQHFPPERNFLPAHITLFHALPCDQEAAIRATLATLYAATPVIKLSLPTVCFLGRSVAIQVESPALIAVRKRLAEQWHDGLSAQDR